MVAAAVGWRPLATTRVRIVLPEPTERLRFRRMETADLDDMTAVLGAPDPVRVDRPARGRDDAERWIEWQQRNYAEHGFGLWVVETHDGTFVGDCGLTMQDVEGHAARRGRLPRDARPAPSPLRPPRRPPPYATAPQRPGSSTWSR